MQEKINNGSMLIVPEWGFDPQKELHLTYLPQEYLPPDEIKTLLWQDRENDFDFTKALDRIMLNLDWRSQRMVRRRISPYTSHVKLDKNKENLILPYRLYAILGHTRKSLRHVFVESTQIPAAFRLRFQAVIPFANKDEKERRIGQTFDDYIRAK